ncbi:MAG: protein kinase [Myxococcota bacterium]
MSDRLGWMIILAPGDRIGHYALERRLGAGGMAEVWSATHTVLGVRAAIKVLFRSTASTQQRLLREGRAQAALDHPNILPVRDIIEIGGSIGLILPLIEGPALDRLLVHYHPTPLETAALLRAIIRGVGHAHEQGLIHRDLKPGNVLLEARWGRLVPRVSDFGLVKDRSEMGQTRDGAIMGTLNYAAPEQILDASVVDHRADLFSLGVMLVEVLTGERPYQARSLGELLEAYAAGPDLSQVPSDWRPVCAQLLTRTPQARLSSCQVLLRAIDDIVPARDHEVLSENGPMAVAARQLWGGGQAPPTQQTVSALKRSRSDSASTFSSAEETISSLLGLSAPPNNLPAEIDQFVGRSADLHRLGVALESYPLVSLLGPGGTGKTRLALQYARVDLARYRGGVYFCDLAEARELDGIAFALGQALDVPLERGDPIATLGYALDGRGECLVILDNFEQIVAHASASVSRWMQRAGRARFVVTSRIPLGVPGEQVMRLQPLNEDEAIVLFTERARARRRGFAVDASNHETVRDLMNVLDRLPLAIELAAARIGVMRPAKMLQRMSQRFRLLSGDRPGSDDRQATLRAAIDWSWDLLEDWEKAAFAQCSVFEGGFTLEAAEDVLDLEQYDGVALPDAPWAVDAIQSLVDRSLIQPMSENGLGERRFGMLMSIQDYARERLTGADADAARARHAAFYAHLGRPEALDALTVAGGTAQWWALSVERDNLQAALRYANPRDIAQIALALAAVVARRGSVGAGEAALLAARQALQSATPSPLLVDVVGTLGQLKASRSDYDAARFHFEGALALAQSLGDKRRAARWESRLGNLMRRQSQYSEAEVHLTAALQNARSHRDIALEAYCLDKLGALDRMQGRYALARQRHEAALKIARRRGDRFLEGLSLGNLGSTVAELGEPLEAEAYYRDALRISQELGDRFHEGLWVGNLGVEFMARGEAHEQAADEHLRAALVIARNLGDREYEGLWLGNLGNLHEDRPEARQYLREGLEVAEDLGDESLMAYCLSGLGEGAARRGDVESARELFSKAEVVLRRLDEPYDLGQLLVRRVWLERAVGERERAEQLLEEVRQIIAVTELGEASELTRSFEEAKEYSDQKQ